MHHFFVSQGPDEKGSIHIVGDDVGHIRRVLRMKPGDAVIVSDGGDRDWYCRIVRVDADDVELMVTDEAKIKELPSGIDLFQGVPKADKMDVVIQKAVELGACRIVPVEMRRCVVKLDEKKKAARLRRWSAISESAAKQCGRGIIPEIGGFTSLEGTAALLKDYDLILVPYENEEGMRGTSQVLGRLEEGMRVAVFIGPEGGFEPSEVAFLKSLGAVPISLGKRILRTETAGMVALSWCMLQLELKQEQV